MREHNVLFWIRSQSCGSNHNSWNKLYGIGVYPVLCHAAAIVAVVSKSRNNLHNQFLSDATLRHHRSSFIIWYWNCTRCVNGAILTVLVLWDQSISNSSSSRLCSIWPFRSQFTPSQQVYVKPYFSFFMFSISDNIFSFILVRSIQYMLNFSWCYVLVSWNHVLIQVFVNIPNYIIENGLNRCVCLISTENVAWLQDYINGWIIQKCVSILKFWTFIRWCSTFLCKRITVIKS